MTPSRCPRSFEVEALRDGRLTGLALAAFGRHLAICASCTREARALDELGEKLRASWEVGSTNELRVLRERTRLLAAFDGALLAPARRPRAWHLVWPVVAAGLALLVVASWPKHGKEEPRPIKADIRAEPEAVWTERREGDVTKVALSRGTLRIHVDHTTGRGRFLVALPDGEIEDRGTTFTVSAEAGHTTRVAVEEGSVLLRLADRAPMTFGPGREWIRESPVRALEPPVRAVETPAPPPAPPATPPRRRAPARGHGATSPAVGPAALEDAAQAFRAAMALLERRQNREAAVAFAHVVEAHGDDPRAEDAAYLLVIALQRSGAESEARGAAETYLRRFPSGFRRAEIESWLQH